MADIIQQRRDTAARWAQYNPILLEGEVGYVTDNPNQYKIGNGRDKWNDLPLRGYDGTITQEKGNDENAVMSQAAVTKELSDLGSKVGRNTLFISQLSVLIEVVENKTHYKESSIYNININKGDNVALTAKFNNLSLMDSLYVEYDDKTSETIAYNIKNGESLSFSAKKDIVGLSFYWEKERALTTGQDVLVLEAKDKFATKTDLERLASTSLSVINIERGGLNVTGGIANASDRARTVNYINAPFSIKANKEFVVYKLYKYKEYIDGSITFVEEKTINSASLSLDEDSFIYKITFAKKNLTDIIEESEIGSIVSEYKGTLSTLNSAVKDIDAYVNALKSTVDTIVVEGVKENATQSTNVFISYEDGVTATSTSTSCERWLITNKEEYKTIKAYLGANSSNVALAIGFYSTESITEEGYLKEYSVPMIAGNRDYVANIPTDAKLIVVFNRNSSLEPSEVKIEILADQNKYFQSVIREVSSSVDTVEVDGKEISYYKLDYFISPEDGITSVSSSKNCDTWLITNDGYKYIQAYLGSNTSKQALAIGFYTTSTMSADGFLKDKSIALKYGIKNYKVEVPKEAKLIAVFNRGSSLATTEATFSLTLDQNDYFLKLMGNPNHNIYLDVPEWYKKNSYLDNKVARINELARDCAGHGDVFFFITDEHVDYNIVNFRSPALIKYISERCPIGKLFNGGDTCNGQDERMRFFVDTIRSAFPHKVYSTMGNHEYMNMQTDSNLYSYFSWFNNDQIGSDKDRNYYYVDNYQQKIRYVVLNAFNISEATKYNDSSLSTSATVGYEQEQLDWLEGVALNVDSGWTIIVVTHVLVQIDMGSDSMYYTEGGSRIASILNNYNKLGKGVVACVIQGHTHRDRLRIVEGDVPVIVTTCDKCLVWKDSNGVADLNVDRTPGTINEQAFDVVVLDKKNRKITAVRIGAPALDGVGNNIGSPVEERVLYY